MDAKTGMTITALATHPANDIKIYQTHPQWTSDGTHIVFRSDRNGSTQYYAYSEASGEIIQLKRFKNPRCDEDARRSSQAGAGA